MKVIERHDIPDQRIGQFRCGSCKSLIETEASDIPHMTKAEDVDDHRVNWWYFPCPVCGWVMATIPERESQ